jgi:adenylate kinase
MRQASLTFTFIVAFGVGLPASAQLQKARIIILVGPPGSGKTVQAEALRKKYKVPAISMAQLVREEVNRHPSVSAGLAASVESGELLADGPANDLVKTRLLRQDAGKGFILDGYPASESQAKVLDQWILDNNLPRPVVVILDVPEAVSRDRLTRRRRPGDESANIERRLAEYREIGRLVEKWYGSEHIVRVDGTGAPSDITLRIIKGIDALPTSKGLKVRSPEPEGLKQREPK